MSSISKLFVIKCILSILLLCCPINPYFYGFYIFYGLLDIFTRYAIKKTKKRKYKALIKGVDYLLFLSMLIIKFYDYFSAYYKFIIIILVLKVIYYLIQFIKYKSFFKLNTRLNNFINIMFYFIVFCYNLYYVIIFIILCIMSLIENIIIVIKNDKCNLDFKSIL